MRNIVSSLLLSKKELQFKFFISSQIYPKVIIAVILIESSEWFKLLLKIKSISCHFYFLNSNPHKIEIIIDDVFLIIYSLFIRDYKSKSFISF